MRPSDVRDGHPVFIGMGSNLGSRIRHLGAAVAALRELALPGTVVCSPVYETRPVGFVEQPDFLNMVAGLAVQLTPAELLERLARIESAHGRVRDIRFGPRTLDLDILLYNHRTVCTQALQIPHPRMWERAFVLIPLADLAPDLPGPGGRTVREWADSASDREGVRYVGRFW